MWYSQARETADALLADESVWKIVLERSNRLAGYSSDRLAKVTRVYHVRKAEELDSYRQANPLLTFDREDFLGNVRRRDRLHGIYRRRAAGPVFQMTYGELSVGIFPRLFEFLGLPDHPVEMRHRKLNASDILARFRPEDHDAIRATLDELGHPEWVQE